MQSVSKVCKALMIKEPFYGLFLLGLNKKYSTSLPTAGVYMEGINFALAINKTFWDNLSEDHKYGVLKHELLHLCFFHLLSRKSYGDMRLFNIAAD